MSFWRKLLHRLGLLRQPGNRFYELGEDMNLTLKDLAAEQGRSRADLASELMSLGLSEYYATDELWQRWEMLSEREQQMVALTCLGYTNGQIAYRMGLSVHTVKFYLHSSLVKFGVRSKADLRQVLGGWDFSAWISHR